MTVYSLQRLPTSGVGTTPGVRPPEPFPPAKPDAGWHPDPHAVHDIASFCSEDQKVTMPRSFRAVIPAGIRTPSGPKSDEGRCSPEIFRRPKGKGPKPERIRDCGPRKAASDLPPTGSSPTRTCPRLLPSTVTSCRKGYFRPEVSWLSISQPKSGNDRHLHTTISKRTLKRAGPCGAVPGSFQIGRAHV